MNTSLIWFLIFDLKKYQILNTFKNLFVFKGLKTHENIYFQQQRSEQIWTQQRLKSLWSHISSEVCS